MRENAPHTQSPSDIDVLRASFAEFQGRIEALEKKSNDMKKALEKAQDELRSTKKSLRADRQGPGRKAKDIAKEVDGLPDIKKLEARVGKAKEKYESVKQEIQKVSTEQGEIGRRLQGVQGSSKLAGAPLPHVAKSKHVPEEAPKPETEAQKDEKREEASAPEKKVTRRNPEKRGERKEVKATAFDNILDRSTTLRNLAHALGGWNIKEKSELLGKDLALINMIAGARTEKEMEGYFAKISDAEPRLKEKVIALGKAEFEERRSQREKPEATEKTEETLPKKPYKKKASYEEEKPAIESMNEQPIRIINKDILSQANVGKKVDSLPESSATITMTDTPDPEESPEGVSEIEEKVEIAADEEISIIEPIMFGPTPATVEGIEIERMHIQSTYDDLEKRRKELSSEITDLDEKAAALRKIKLSKRTESQKEELETIDESIVKKSALMNAASDNVATLGNRLAELDKKKADIEEKETAARQPSAPSAPSATAEMIPPIIVADLTPEDVINLKNEKSELEAKLAGIDDADPRHAEIKQEIAEIDAHLGRYNLNIEKSQLENGQKRFKPTDPQYKLIQERINDIERTIAGETDVAGNSKDPKYGKYDLKGPDEEKAMWAEEKQQAKVLLDTARSRYERQMKAEILTERKSSFWQKIKRSPSRLLEEIGWKDAKESPEYIKLREEYDTAKKRYGNTIANEHWIEVRETHGDVPSHTEITKKDGSKDFIENNLFNVVQAEVSKKLIENIAIPEYQAMKKAKTEGLPPQEKTRIKKIMESYSKLPWGKRVMLSAAIGTGIAASIGATGLVAVPSAAVLFGTRFISAAVLAPLAGVGGKFTKGLFSVKAKFSRNKRLEQLEDNYSIISGISDVEKVEQEFEKKEFRNKIIGILTTGAIAVTAGIKMREALAEAGLYTPASATSPKNPGVTPDTAKSGTLPVKPDYETPYDSSSLGKAMSAPLERTMPPVTDSVNSTEIAADEGEMERYVREQGIPDSASDRPSADAQLNPAVPGAAAIVEDTASNASETAPTRTFTDKIEDKMRGARVIKSDSFELSAKRIFENNAEELGFDKTKSGMSLKRWAIMKVDELVKEFPQVRDTIAHDGGEIKIAFNPDKSVAGVQLEKGSISMPAAESGIGEKTVAAVAPTEAEPIPKAKVVAAPEAKETVELEKGLPEPDSKVLLEAEGKSTVGKETVELEASDFKSALPIENGILNEVSANADKLDPMIVANAVSKELTIKVGEIFKPESKYLGLVKVSPLNSESWFRASNLSAKKLLDLDLRGDVKGFIGSNDLPRSITREQLAALKEVVATGKEYGVLTRGSNVGDVMRKVIEKQEIEKILTTASK